MPANVESMFSVRQMPWHRGADVVEVLPGGLDQAVGGVGDLLGGLGLEDHPQGVAGFLDVAGDPSPVVRHSILAPASSRHAQLNTSAICDTA